jgi:peptide/nickel transport system substrate-binding protein
MYRRFHAILHEEQPYTFLFNSQRKVAISNRFQGVTPYALGFDMRDWWVPLDQQRYK